MRDQNSSGLTVRAAHPADAAPIIDLHYAAVHQTASAFYPPEVLDHWSTRPDDARCLEMRKIIETGDELVLVVEDPSGIVAFGSIVPRLRELRAVYVHPRAGRRGIGSHLLSALEQLSVARGVLQLHVTASVNAENFYRQAGYDVVEHGAHRLRTGQEMRCVRMIKFLESAVV